jgi:hypothetical protein
MLHTGDADIERSFRHLKYRLRGRQEAVRGEKLPKSNLARSVSPPMAKSEPRADASKHFYPRDIHSALEELVKGSTEEDSSGDESEKAEGNGTEKYRRRGRQFSSLHKARDEEGLRERWDASV